MELYHQLRGMKLILGENQKSWQNKNDQKKEEEIEKVKTEDTGVGCSKGLRG